MTATYPLESIFCSERERNKARVEESLEEEETEMALHDTSKPLEQSLKDSTTTNNNNEGKRPDPDKLYLPFWVGSFVIASQLFIYCVVIFNVFRGDIPPNADLVLRLAEVCTIPALCICFSLCVFLHFFGFDIVISDVHLLPSFYHSYRIDNV